MFESCENCLDVFEPKLVLHFRVKLDSSMSACRSVLATGVLNSLESTFFATFQLLSPTITDCK